MNNFQKYYKISLVDILYHVFPICIMNFHHQKDGYDLSQSNDMAHMGYEL